MTTKEIAVIGAGLAGLAAALRAEENGHSVTVFEARNRVGGRVWTEEFRHQDGTTTPIERGAEFIIDGYDEFRTLLTKFGLSTVDTGMSYYKREPIDVPQVSLSELASAGQQLTNTLSAQDHHRPITELLRESGLPEPVQRSLQARVEISTALPADQVSGETLLQGAAFSDAPSWRVQGGNQQLPLAMAKALTSPIRLGEEVISIDLAEVVTLTTTFGRYDFDACIVAVPLGVLRKTRLLEPYLSAFQNEVLGAIQQGHAAKFHAGLSIEPPESATMSVESRYWCWTARRTEAQVGPVLNAFMGSASAIDRLLANEDPRAAWFDQVSSLRPDLVFSDDADPVFTNWKDDKHAFGAYSGRPPGLTNKDLMGLVEVRDSLLLAGEYLGGEKMALMEGAIRSGYKAADTLHSSHD